MHYVSAEFLTKAYGIKPLFSNISFHIEEGDKIALVARNGSGKTTLLRILAGKETPDHGKIWIHKDVDIALFEQDVQVAAGTWRCEAARPAVLRRHFSSDSGSSSAASTRLRPVRLA